MANFQDIVNTPARILAVGYPGTGKTSALAALANAGLKLRIQAYDKIGNIVAPLRQYVKPEFYKNIDVVALEDELKVGNRFIMPDGVPTAFARGLQLMEHWCYKRPDGTEVDLGVPKNDWGPDTICVLDSMTGQTRAAFLRSQKALNKDPSNTTRQVWGWAASDQERFYDILTGAQNNFHVYVTAHLKLIGPDIVEKDDDAVTREVKERLVDLVPTRLFPTAVGRQLAQSIAGYFPTVLLFEAGAIGTRIRRRINTAPRPDVDVKLPAELTDTTFDISDGLLKIFTALTGGPEVWFAQTNTGQDDQSNQTKED